MPVSGRLRYAQPSGNLQHASDMDSIRPVARKPRQKRRSGCPVSVSLDIFGDRWSLIIVRDLMVRGYRTFREFLEAGEGIATNILADRLHKLEAAGILTAEPRADDGRSAHYRLTAKGIALAPVLLELLLWAARHEETAAPCSLIAEMGENREAVLAEVYRRWEERDPAPLLPPFTAPANRRISIHK
jgi:DNA-binding HxlR family transcriptional regulator